MSTDVKNSSLATNLVSYWELEEASGTRVDSHGSNDLTDNNTVGQATGIQGNGADLELSNTEWLSRSGDTVLGPANDYTYAFWFKPESITTFHMLMERGGVNDSFCHTRMYIDSVGSGVFSCSAGGSLKNIVLSSGSFTVGNWYHIVFVKRSSGTGMEVYVNGSSAGTNAGETGNVSNTGSSNFQIGARRNTGQLPFDGVIDEFGVWNRVLTTGEISALYNSGAGIPYDNGGAGGTPYRAKQNFPRL